MCRGQGVLGPLGRLWQRLQQLNPGGQVVDGFQIGRAVAGLLARPLPVGNSLLSEARLRVVMRQQLGLGLHGLGKLLHQHLCSPLMGLLPRTFE
jgi:hypothetical protein